MKRIKTITSVLAVATLLLTTTTLAGPYEGKKVSMGVGLGVPYGVLGSSMDVNVAPNLDLTMGLGTTIFAGMGYSFGVKYFLGSAQRNFRPRISAYYGTNSMFVDGANTATAESYTGFSLGLGSRWMWGQSKTAGIDFDVILIASTGLDIDKLKAQGYTVAEPGRVKISIGFRRAF